MDFDYDFDYEYSDYYISYFPDAIHCYCEKELDTSLVGILFCVIIFIIGVLGNGLLLYDLVTHEELKKPTNLYILNLACSDLVIMFTLLFSVVECPLSFLIGNIACRFVRGAYRTGRLSSIIFMTAMSLDRFTTAVLSKTTVDPVKRRWCAIGVCALAWMVSLYVTIDHFDIEILEVDGRIKCEAIYIQEQHKVRSYLYLSLFSVCPFITIVSCYSAILWTVLWNTTKIKFRTVLLTLCTFTAYLVCCVPHNILVFIVTVYNPHIYCDIAMYISFLLAMSYSCMNPLVYLLSLKLRHV